MSRSARTPLSIESLVEKQRAEQEAASKPKFLTREERAKLAIERRTAEIKGEREKENKAREERERLEREAESLKVGERGGGRDRDRDRDRGRDVEMRDGRYDRDRDRDRGERYGGRYEDRNARRDSGRRNDDRPPPPSSNRPAFQNGIPTGPRADRQQPAAAPPPTSSKPGTPPPPPGSPPRATLPTESSAAPFVPPISDSDLSAIRSRYLGVDKKKRKIRKMNDRKFVFDWDEQEDTGMQAARQGAVMFGRGHLAGMEDGGGGSRSSSTGPERMADAKERRAAARHGADERHWTEKPLHEMRDRDWRIFREDFSIACRGGNIPLPLRSWTESAIPQTILDVIASIGYEEPSPIQRQAIPIGLQNRDVIGIAETGSGKTAAFVIPMLVYIQSLPPLDDHNRHLGPFALILAPTRELAQQIETETRKFATPLGYKCVSINQEQREAALQALRTGEADVLVATDLAGRGIDVQDVSLVINYQMASTIEAYVHRIGRTGRAGKTGVAITFLTNDDDEVMYELKQEISKSPISKVPPELARHEAAQQKVTRDMKRKREGEDQG
ncbi:mRNA splicing protein prp28 [Ceratobasidium sp. UAMH 11750]|nr:mRNA splicing protein prp28 [Ceratobasidium sp. UAMH 11750]